MKTMEVENKVLYEILDEINFIIWQELMPRKNLDKQTLNTILKILALLEKWAEIK